MTMVIVVKGIPVLTKTNIVGSAYALLHLQLQPQLLLQLQPLLQLQQLPLLQPPQQLQLQPQPLLQPLILMGSILPVGNVQEAIQCVAVIKTREL